MKEEEIDEFKNIDVIEKSKEGEVVEEREGIDGDGMRREDRLEKIEGDEELLKVRIKEKRMLEKKERREREILMRIVKSRIGREEMENGKRERDGELIKKERFGWLRDWRNEF